MKLGSFSVSLAVKDIVVSRAFYEKLGFDKVGGDPSQNWLILRNGARRAGCLWPPRPMNQPAVRRA